MSDTNVLLNFDATTVDPTFGGGGGFFPVSDKRGHLVVISASKGFVNASSGKGQFLELVLTGQEGAVAGMEAPLRLNLMHEKPAAVSAAYAQLSAIAHVTGVMRVGSVSELFNRPFRVVSVEQKQTDEDKAAGKTPFTNLADNGILDANGNPPGKAGHGPQQAATAPQMTQQQPPQMQQQQPPAQQMQQGSAAAGPNWGQQQAAQQMQGGPAQQQQQQSPDWGQGQQQQQNFGGQQQGGAPSWATGPGQ